MSQPSFLTLYKRLETIGRCAHTSVSKGIHIPTENVIDLDTVDIQCEVVFLLQLCNASNITNYFGCYMDNLRVWIAMKQVCGRRQRAVLIRRKLLEGEIREWSSSAGCLLTWDNFTGLLSFAGTSNQLVSATCKVMICDFGVLALPVTTLGKQNTTGTLYFMAPGVDACKSNVQKSERPFPLNRSL
ncbi:hypothetical protein ARMGADRAFT_552540 [Armillaria gallica]|uniref:Uncharacterized protein n=1 Tax=Armillaria gallica TaxID=47427 RepID=A0A2H3CRS1_ARMGA|nr:hypothetical protein ARMGADRAFT_552540 [Armillaria gallica]